ncbi:MAG: M48 family metalloprotease, partial [Deltaproteobacteria bacterium]|nr:M48 family metalloprotease [Deltaproteobacteria bacterium]
MLFALLAAFVMLMGQLAGGRTGMLAALAVAILMNAGIYWFSARLVLSQTGARVVGPREAPELHRMVEHLARNAGLPTPRIAVVEDPSPNAFATGRNPSHAVVAVTRGLLDMMDREELAGVLSHELAHVKHRDILLGSAVAAMVSAMMLFLPVGRYVAAPGHGRRRASSVLLGLLLSLLGPAAGALVQAAISRSREYMADEEGADIAQTPDGLADALEKLASASDRPVAAASPATASLFIVNPISGAGMSALFAT